MRDRREPAVGDEDPHQEPDTVYSLLAGRARASSDIALVIWTAAGLLGVVAIVLARPRAILLTLVSGCIGLFGLWGILDRELTDRQMAPRRSARVGAVLDATRWLVAAMGTAAALAAVLLGFGRILGRWIS